MQGKVTNKEGHVTPPGTFMFREGRTGGNRMIGGGNSEWRKAVVVGETMIVLVDEDTGGGGCDGIGGQRYRGGGGHDGIGG